MGLLNVWEKKVKKPFVVLFACMGAVSASLFIDNSAAQIAPTNAPQSRLITLGTRGGPIPSKDRAQSSNLLIVNDTYYLIDAGDGVLRRLVQAGANFRKVGKVFITHMTTIPQALERSCP